MTISDHAELRAAERFGGWVNPPLRAVRAGRRTVAPGGTFAIKDFRSGRKFVMRSTRRSAVVITVCDI